MLCPNLWISAHIPMFLGYGSVPELCFKIWVKYWFFLPALSYPLIFIYIIVVITFVRMFGPTLIFSAKHTGHLLPNLINYVFSSANDTGDSYKRTVQHQVFFQNRLILTCIWKLNIHDKQSLSTICLSTILYSNNFRWGIQHVRFTLSIN